MKKLRKWLKSLFKTKKPKSVSRTAPLTDKDKRYLKFLISKKKKALHRRGKKFTNSHRRTLIKEIKDARYTHEVRVQSRDSGWGFLEYYLLFHFINSPSHYYSSDFVSSPEWSGDGGGFSGGGASDSWTDDGSGSNSDDSSDSSDSSSDSSDYSSDSSDSSSYDSGGSFDSGGSSDSSSF